MRSTAAGMIDRKGIAFAKKYLDRVPGVEHCPCEYGHPDCAHYKKGPCSVELAGLVKGFSKPVTCAGELMGYGVSPEEAMS